VTLEFLNTKADGILKGIKTTFEGASNRTLYPAQTENLLLHTLAYRETLLRHDIQHCAEQNLVAYAIGEHLDALGVMMDTPRLQPTAAECRVRFTLDTPSQSGRSFGAGTRVTTEDGKVAFETLDAAYVISGHSASSVVVARCTALGTGGNGLDAGVVCAIDPAIEGVSVENITGTEGGGDLESDRAYRERLSLSAARFGCGGSAKAYRYWALSSSSLVADALAVNGAERGDILIYILSNEGDPSVELLATVREVCNQNDVRLIGDRIDAVAAIRREYSIRAEVTVFDSHDSEIVLDKVRALAAEYALAHRARLGADITPTQVMLALGPLRDGIYNVNLIEPHEIISIGEAEWAECTEIDIRLAGVSHG